MPYANNKGADQPAHPHFEVLRYFIFYSFIQRHTLKVNINSVNEYYFYEDYLSNPAGNVTRVSVLPRKVTVKIGDAENRCRGCRDKSR